MNLHGFLLLLLSFAWFVFPTFFFCSFNSLHIFYGLYGVHVCGLLYNLHCLHWESIETSSISHIGQAQWIVSICDYVILILRLFFRLHFMISQFLLLLLRFLLAGVIIIIVVVVVVIVIDVHKIQNDIYAGCNSELFKKATAIKCHCGAANMHKCSRIHMWGWPVPLKQSLFRR